MTCKIGLPILSDKSRIEKGHILGLGEREGESERGEVESEVGLGCV